MNTITNEKMLNRALFIDFDLYAENDPDFKQELIELMIENLHELRQAHCRSVDPTRFAGAFRNGISAPVE